MERIRLSQARPWWPWCPWWPDKSLSRSRYRWHPEKCLIIALEADHLLKKVKKNFSGCSKTTRSRSWRCLMKIFAKLLFELNSCFCSCICIYVGFLTYHHYNLAMSASLDTLKFLMSRNPSRTIDWWIEICKYQPWFQGSFIYGVYEEVNTSLFRKDLKKKLSLSWFLTGFTFVPLFY